MHGFCEITMISVQHLLENNIISINPEIRYLLLLMVTGCVDSLSFLIFGKATLTHRAIKCIYSKAGILDSEIAPFFQLAKL